MKHAAALAVACALALAPRATRADDDGDIEIQDDHNGPVGVVDDDGPPTGPHVDAPIRLPPRDPHAAPPPPVPPTGLPHRAAFVAAWTTARACLVGAPAWTANQTDARSIQQALGGDAATCGPLVLAARDLARDADSDPGFHAGWFDVAHALDDLGADPGGRKIALADAELARILAIAVPTARATIPKVVVPPSAPVIPHTDNARDVSLSVPLVDHETVLAFNNPKTYADATTRPMHDTAWRAALGDTGLAIDGKVIAPALTSASGFVVGTLGDGAERTVLIVAYGGRASIARSHDGGAHWLAPAPLTTGRADIKLRGAGPGYTITWAQSARATVALDVNADGTVAPPLALPTGDLARVCTTPGGAFWVEHGTGRVGHADAHATKLLGTFAGADLVACGATGAVVQTADALALCDASRCAVAVRTSRGFADLRARGGAGLVWARASGRYIALGETDTPTRVIELSDGELAGVRGTDRGIELLVSTTRGIVRVQP